MFERRDLPGGPAALVSTLFEDAGFLAAFTERTGGVSTGRFASLNLGLATDDEPALVLENRRRLVGSVPVEGVAALRQVHGSTVVRVDEGRDWGGYAGGHRVVPAGDALATSCPGLGLVVLTADCVPVALADPVDGLVVAVHAGWRGVAAGVVQAAASSFVDPARAIAAVGPAVGPDHYEVGDDVARAVASGAGGRAVTRQGGRRLHLDLPATIVGILRQLGIRRIDTAEDCTACHPERFFSFRRDGPTGRQGLIAARLR